MHSNRILAKPNASSDPVFAEPLQQVDSTHVLWRGRKLLYFGGCDYLRLSRHPSVMGAVQKGLQKFGLNVAASRKTTGNHQLYEEVERLTARYFGSERAVLVSSGYLANLVVAQGLVGRISCALIDERAHASLQDALKFLRAKAQIFKHRDPEDLRRQFSRIEKSRSVAVLTDGLFAHDGSVAPLAEYRRILGRQALLWVDDSHAAGILGKKGRGTIEIAGLDQVNTIQTITFSKGFGVYGGALLCDKNISKLVLQKSHIVTGNTPLPLPLVNGIIAALESASAELRKKLDHKIREFIHFAEMKLLQQPTPIISIEPSSRENAQGLQKALLKASIYPCFIQYPGGPEEGYFRFAISVDHSLAELERLGSVLAAHRR